MVINPFRQLFVFLLFFGFCNLAYAQITRMVQEDTSFALSEFTGEYYIQSNSISNDFISHFTFKPGFIDLSLKDKVLNQLHNENLLGAHINYGIRHYQSFSNKDLKFILTIENKEYLNAKFSRDMFRLAFYGNKPFAGQTAYLDNFNLNLLKYQKFGAGVLWTSVDSVAKLGVGLNFLNGQQGLFVQADKAQLYTSEDGQYIDFNSSISWNESDSLNKGFLNHNGYGFSADLFFEAPFKMKKHAAKIGVEIKDIGFINWNKKSISFNNDSLYHFEGIEIKDIFQLKDTVLESISKDSVFENLSANSNGFTTVIPSSFNLYMATHFGKLELINGIQYIFRANSNMLFYARGNYLVGEKFRASLGISYGGYGGLSCNLGIQKIFAGGFSVKLYSNNIEGYIMPKQTTAQSISVSIAKLFY